jgi:hypothetical protein
MTPEEAQMVKAHADAIAAILYRDADTEKLNSLEDIEQTVRQQVLEHVSPHIGTFLFKKRPKPQPGDSAPSKAASESSKSPKNKRKQ